MTLGYSGNLYILAFDHRGSFQKKMLGIKGQPTDEQTEKICAAKKVIFEGFQSAVDQGVPKNQAGFLVDEQFGADIVREAKKDEALIFAVPVEKSGQDEFDFEYEEEFGDHIEEFDPTFAKVLVRYNPDGDKEMNERQTGRLKKLSNWLHGRDRKFLFELLVPAEQSQLDSVGEDVDRYDREIRPGLMLRAISELQSASVEPDVWKIEGIDTRQDCERIGQQVRADGRDGVVCVVLGRGADSRAVEHWLRQGASVPGYVGFAIGRTIWWDSLKDHLFGTIDREDAAKRIAANYRHFIDVYDSAR